jgi:hypothetical protein
MPLWALKGDKLRYIHPRNLVLMVNYELERNGRGLIEVYQGICQEGQRKPTKDRSQDNRCAGRDFSRAFPEYKSKSVTDTQACSVA